MLRRLWQGVLANLFGQFGTAVMQLVGVPIFLHFWGLVQYGEWLLIYTIPGYFGLADMGLGTVAANAMCMHVAKGEIKAALAVFDTVLWMLVLGCAALVLVVLAVMYGWPIHSWFSFSYLSESQLYACVAFFLAYSFFAMLSGLLNSIYRSEEAYARAQLITNSLRLLEFFVIMLGVVAGQGLVFAAAALFTTRLVGFLFIYLDLRRRYAWFRVVLNEFSVATARSLFQPAMAFFIFPTGHVMLNQGLVVLVAKSLGPTAVVTFSTLRTLVNFLRQMVSVLNQSAWPEFSRLLAKESIELAQLLFFKIIQLSLGLLLLATIFLHFFTPPFLSYWTLGKVSVEQPFYSILLLSAGLATGWNTAMIVSISVNAHSRIAYAFLAGALVAFGAAWYFVEQWGLLGVALALLALDIWMLPITFQAALRLLGSSFSSLNRALFDFSFSWKTFHDR